ncbi:Proteoglycan Cow [Amphibalanus amphitrite]|uniref:Proteoglycan Cow n=1 Tax=Amphibalanus amphitrite TaxID=1232801 RepID=A0A6A4VZC1_AMPAM|nr:Proteoglycan Cow [Amphibalanus amphitrite]
MNEEEKKEKECHECPYTHPSVSAYICGTDNRTYSSLCRLEQHNCIHDTLVTANCKGFCPCKETTSSQRRKQKMFETASQSKQKYGSSKKSSKARLRSKYDKYQKERKSYNNVKYYPKGGDRVNKYQQKCSRTELDAMGARLADWFVVIKSTNGGVKPNYKHHKYYSTHFPSACRPMAQWMFLYLDTDSDGQLTQRELYAVERDEHEPCLKPFLDSCDLNSDLFLTTREWCTCFQAVPAPCNDRQRENAARLGAYTPACDGDGFFRPTQCHGSQCWCADRYGVEQKGTRTRRGNTRCDVETSRYDAEFNIADEDDEDNYVVEGSGSGPLLEF